ncbi:nucleoside monophosphate kinase [Candidatus Woesearchaeota archaeon]|nr:nucleoside monophosphate kinase [Candidatus Woesearchaeota archaeon]
MKLIIMGPPGSGKGTVSERLEKEYGWLHVSPGELLREEVVKGTRIGKEIKSYIESGKLVPDRFVVEMVKLEVKGKDNYILDGFPRSLDQAKSIEELKIDIVIYLDVSEEEVIKRFAGRRVCEQGTHGYHVQYLPPKKEGICDVDGSKLVQRKDDTPKVIKQRFKIFHEQTETVRKFYDKKKMAVKIDASKEPEKVYDLVKKVVKEMKKQG